MAVDESEATDRVVTFVNGFFSGMDVEVIGVNVARLPGPYVPAAVPWGGMYAWGYTPGAGPGVASGSAVEAESDEVRRQAERTVESAGLEGAEAAVEVGDPAEAIERAAREHGADLIVVGSSGKSFFQRLLSPSVSRELVDEAAVPVLVVH